MRSTPMRWLLFLVAVSLAAIGRADAEANLQRRLATVPPSQAPRVIAEYRNAPAPLGTFIASFGTNIEPREVDLLKDWLEERREIANRVPTVNANNEARRILSNPLYSDRGVAEDSNWLGQALARLRNIRMPELRLPRGPRGPNLAIGQFIQSAVYILLAALVVVFAVVAFRHIKWKQGLARKAKALLEEDEPVRTRDEWLESADKLESEGRYREAIRALYLACLLAFDERRVARFERRETNWEHLRRIESSPKLPAGLDFRAPTQLFDRAWYGFQVEGSADVARFRAWYAEVMQRLREES